MAAKKAAAKRAADKNDNDSKDDDVQGESLTDEQTEALEGQAFGADAPGVEGIAAGRAALPPQQEPEVSKELKEKREEIGAVPGFFSHDGHLTSATLDGVEGNLEVSTAEGRLTVKGDAVLDQTGAFELKRLVDEAIQAVS